MLSIIILLLSLLIVNYLTLKQQNKKHFRGLGIVLKIILFLELLCYIFFLWLINQGTSFFLIGNQSILDRLIKVRFVEKHYSDRYEKDSLFRLDDDLGYTLSDKSNLTNAQGLRNHKEYRFASAQNTLRMVVFGDSFVYGRDEEYENTWPYLLESSVGNLEVLNFGVPGYGVGQSYLRFLEEGLKFNPDILFFNTILLSGRDQFPAMRVLKTRGIRDSNTYRVHFWLEKNQLRSQVISPLNLFDPQFRDQFIYQPLALKENPSYWSLKIFSVSNIGLLLKNTFLPKQYLKNMQAKEYQDLDANVEILQNLLLVAKKNKIKVLFFVATNFNDLPLKIQYLIKHYKNWVVYSNSSLLELAGYYGYPFKELLNEGNHYNAQGHQIYTKKVAAILSSHEWGFGDRTFTYADQSKSFLRYPTK